MSPVKTKDVFSFIVKGKKVVVKAVLRWDGEKESNLAKQTHQDCLNCLEQRTLGIHANYKK